MTLSASYIGLPESVITTIMKKDMEKDVTCIINNKTYFVECTSSSKHKLEKVLEKVIFFDFGGRNINLPLSDLTYEGVSKKKLILNIKKTFNNRVILGEPVFKKHYVVFDYSKNKFGFADKRKEFNDLFVDIVTLVRFLCLVFVIGSLLAYVGCIFIICFQPCRKMIMAFGGSLWKKQVGGEGRRLRQYSPIQENPYDDLKGKIQDVISNVEKDEVEGI